MILVDTSIWVEHLRSGSIHLKSILEEGEVACHPFIIGELACGNMKNRKEVISLLQALPFTKAATDDEIIHFIEANQIMGIGLGLVDVHLLASSLLSNVHLWTTDKSLIAAAKKLNVNYVP